MRQNVAIIWDGPFYEWVSESTRGRMMAAAVVEDLINDFQEIKKYLYPIFFLMISTILLHQFNKSII